ncbi:MAG: pyridoxamine 5'-phosphate oxidase family protein, partial [Chloroflexota bacterium]
MASDNIKKYSEKPRSEIRRPEYAIDDQGWIKDLLNRGAFGTLGTVNEQQPFLTPVLFLYIEEEAAIYFHTAQVGRTRSNSELAPAAAFNISEFGRMLPHKDAVDFNVEYNSVTVFGTIQMIEDKDEKDRILQFLLDKYAPHLTAGVDYNHIQPEETNRTAVYQLSIEDWS